jgi:glutaryl-CoA dehydrogenase
MQTEITLGLQASLRVGQLIDAGRMAPEMISDRQAQQLRQGAGYRPRARDMHGGNGISGIIR